MTLGLRKFALTAHVIFSVGWLGAVAGFLALAVAGLISQDAQTVRSVYVSMALTAWFVILPLSFASLLSGLVESLSTPWGLLRHYWVLAKLLITVFASILLLVHMQPIGRMAGEAAVATLSSADFHSLRVQLVADAAAALVALLVTTALSVYKPQGMTPYGRRRQLVAEMPSHPSEPGLIRGTELTLGPQPGARKPRWVYAFAIVLIVLVHVIVIQHVTSGGHGHHMDHTSSRP